MRRITIVDCPMHSHFGDKLVPDFVYSTNPLASLTLSKLGIVHTKFEALLSAEDLLLLHEKVVNLKNRLREKFDKSPLVAEYPNVFCVYDPYLNLLFFSFLSKLKEFDLVFGSHSKEKDSHCVTFVSDRSSFCVPNYPLREDDHIYAWILGKIAHKRGMPLEIENCGKANTPAHLEQMSTSGSFFFKIRTLRKKIKYRPQVSELLRRLGRTYYSKWSRTFRYPQVVGRLNSQLIHLPISLWRDLKLVWNHADDILLSGLDKVRLGNFSPEQLGIFATKQEALQGEIQNIIADVFEEHLTEEQHEILMPMMALFVSSLKDYVLQCATIEGFLEKEAPLCFVSSILSGIASERLIALMCRQRDIPVVGEQHGGNYGDLDEKFAGAGAVFYLEELDLCDMFIAWGAGTAKTLSCAQKTYRPKAIPTRILAGNALSFPTKSRVPKVSSSSLKNILYIAHSIIVNAVNKAWLRDRYAEYVLSMYDVLERSAGNYKMVVKLHPGVDRWQMYLYDEIKERCPHMELVRGEVAVARLIPQADLIVIDVPSTTLCEALPHPIHIATVELLNDMYPGQHMVKPEALEMLRKRCLVASTYQELLSVVEMCLKDPGSVNWPDVLNQDYFHSYVKNPDGQSDYETYRTVFREILDKEQTR